MNDIENCKSAEGHYSIGTFNIQSENHASVQSSLKKRKNCQRISNSDTEQYPCIWCKCSKCEFHDIHREFSILDRQKMARSL